MWIARNPPGFAFVEFEDDRDARDAVRDMDGRFILDKRIRVEISRRGRAAGGGAGRGGDRESTRGGPPNRGDFRVKITNLPANLNWRDLKDFLRNTIEPVFVDIIGGVGIAEFKSESDADRVIDKLDDTKYEGAYIRIAMDGGSKDRKDRSRSRSRDRPARRDRSRSRS